MKQTATARRDVWPGRLIDDFQAWLRAKGFRQNTIELYWRGARRFVEFAGRHRTAVSEAVPALLAFKRHLSRRRELRYRTGSHMHRFVAARHFVSFLQDRGLVARSPPSREEEPPLLAEFCQWMREHRGVVERSLEIYKQVIPALLASVGDVPEAFEARRLRAFVLRRANRPQAMRRAPRIVNTIRTFLRFLVVTGRCTPEIVAAMPGIASWKLSSLPRHLSPDETEQVISACEPSTPMGCRDRAVILLLVRLGLRASDVAGMRVGDIDWEKGTLAVMGKSRREERLPLTQEVGDAILCYLERRGPDLSTDRVFLAVQAPLRPLSRIAVGLIARRAMNRARVKTPVRGAHVLRHTAATNMLRAGVSMHEIGAVLRHASIETTAIYTKVDLDLLREIAVPWPEQTQC